MDKNDKDEVLDGIAPNMVSGEIWYAALVDVHRWFAEAVAARDFDQVARVLQLMDQLELI